MFRMLMKIMFSFVTLNSVACQLNGEFWWLNSKLAQLNHVEPPRPKFEDISEFDTDESAKVVFRDTNDRIEEVTEKYIDTTAKISEAIIHFRDDSKLSHPNISTAGNVVQNNIIDTFKENKTYVNNQEEDLLNFVFPNDVAMIKNKAKTNETKSTSDTGKTNTKPIILSDKILFDTENKTFLSESICTYMKEKECNRCNGVPYTSEDKSSSLKNSIKLKHICCVLPLKEQKSSKIIFPDSYYRLKRSTNEQDVSSAHKQRNALMQKKYGSQNANTQATTITTASEKIVTPDTEYIDPYWNIKGSTFKRPDKQGDYLTGSSQTEYDDYTEELPRPGLVGLYSDHLPSSWSFINAHKGFSYYNDDNSEEVESIRYSTIDPRRGSSASASKIKRRLLKLTTSSIEDFVHPESQTVNYHSNPDFQVLQGFKLPNLTPKTKGRPMRNSMKIPTTERYSTSGVVKNYHATYIDSDYDDYMEIKQQLYKECGRTKDEYFANSNCDREVGESPQEANPWLLLAVLTKRKQSILCYATLVHPRAAITAADCTYGIASGEITIVAGMWDLKEDNRQQLQHRLASVYAHQQYTPGKLAYNIALLYWRRPLTLDATVQPACISDATADDECLFVGWGGYDQAIRHRPHWQRASILSTLNCEEQISINQEFDLPLDAFCATVESKTTVTGLGGPLICKMEDTYSVAGVAIWRDEIIVLMRIQEWTIKAMGALGIH